MKMKSDEVIREAENLVENLNQVIKDKKDKPVGVGCISVVLMAEDCKNVVEKLMNKIEQLVTDAD